MKSLWGVIVIVGLGCGNKTEPDKADHAEKKVVEPKAHPLTNADKPEATAAFFGTKIGPLGPLAKLKMGMTQAEVKAAAPEFFNAKGSDQLVDAPVKDLAYGVSFLDGRVNSFRISNLGKGDYRPAIAKAWGPGIDAKDEIDRAETVWFDPQTHWRAVAEAPTTIGGSITIMQYLPAADLLGPDPVAFAAFPKPLLGATADEVRAGYPQYFESQTKEQLDASAKKAEDEAKSMGVANANLGRASAGLTDLKLPPTEWDGMYTSVLLLFDDTTHKVREYHFTITDKNAPGAKEATLALFKKKWGEPKVKKSYKEQLIFHAKAPAITISRDAMDAGWEVEVAPKPDDF